MNNINKQKIFEEFKKQKKENAESDTQTEYTKQITQEDIKTVITNNKKNKKRKKKIKKVFNDDVHESIQTLDKFEEWKKDFLSSDINKEFMQLLEYYRSKQFDIFTDEEFLKNKFQHPKTKTIVIDPTQNELKLGKGGSCYLIKPLYAEEYSQFIKDVGPRNEHIEEFIRYCIKKAVLFPDTSTIDITKEAAGTVLALYNHILEISNLTKTIRVLEI